MRRRRARTRRRKEKGVLDGGARKWMSGGKEDKKTDGGGAKNRWGVRGEGKSLGSGGIERRRRENGWQCAGQNVGARNMVIIKGSDERR
ncbi:hypothetical protein Tco_0270822 [Tanacetum coccineum]